LSAPTLRGQLRVRLYSELVRGGNHHRHQRDPLVTDLPLPPLREVLRRWVSVFGDAVKLPGDGLCPALFAILVGINVSPVLAAVSSFGMKLTLG
jgi:hypothetical protein